MLLPGKLQVVEKLKVQPNLPNLRFVAEVTGEAQGRVGRNAPFSVQDIRDAARRNTKFEGEPIPAHRAGRQFIGKDRAGM